MKSRSVIARSHQIWKVVVGAVLLVTGSAACLVVTYMAASHSPRVDQWYGLQVLGMVIGFAGFVYLCAGTRCPQCGAKWIWMGVMGRLSPKSLDTLLTLERCPTCGYAGCDRAEVPKP
jgi:peptidoglycan/LPS O-acetylase OafA/YrhL